MLTDFSRVPEQDNLPFDGLMYKRGNVATTHETLGTDNEPNEKSDFFSTFLEIANEQDSDLSKSGEESVSTGVQRNDAGDRAFEVNSRPETQPDTQRLIGEKEEPETDYSKTNQVLEAKEVDESIAEAPKRKTLVDTEDRKGGGLPGKSGTIKGLNAGEGHFPELESILTGQAIMSGAKKSRDSSRISSILSVKKNPGVTGQNGNVNGKGVERQTREGVLTKVGKESLNLKDVQVKVNGTGIEKQAREGFLTKVGKESLNLKDVQVKVNDKGIEKQAREVILTKAGKEPLNLKDAHGNVNDKGIERQTREGILTKVGKESLNLKDVQVKVNDKGIEKQAREVILTKAGKEPLNLKDAHGNVNDKGIERQTREGILTKVGKESLNLKDVQVKVNDKGIEKQAREVILTKAGKEPLNLKDAHGNVNDKGIEKQAREVILTKAGKEPLNLKDAHGNVNDKGIERQTREGILTKVGKESLNLKDVQVKVNDKGIEKQAREVILTKAGKEPLNLKDAHGNVNDKGNEKQTREGVLTKVGKDRLTGESGGKETPNLKRAYSEYVRVSDQGSGQESERQHSKAKVNSLGLSGPDDRQLLNTKEILARGETLTSREAPFSSEKGKAWKKGSKSAQETPSLRDISSKSNSNNSRTEVFLDQGSSRGDNLDQGKRDPRFKLSPSAQSQEASESSKGNPKDQTGGGTETKTENDYRSIKLETPVMKRSNKYHFDKAVPKTEISAGENSTTTASNQTPSTKTVGTSSHLGEMKMINRSFQENGLRQLVEKAAFNLKNGRSEVKIDLKPELLGQVRMQISTENHQVTVRILAALPIAKEMIENNLPQLKAELQSHGLEIERFDVSLSQGNDRNKAEYDALGSRKMKKGSGQKRDSKAASNLEEGKNDQAENRNTRANGINLFA